MGRSSCDLNFVSRIICTSYILKDNELGDGEDIDRFVMPQGMFTPRISVIRCAEYSEFCMDRSIETSPYVTGFTRHGILNEIISDSKNSNICKRTAGSGTMGLNLELQCGQMSPKMQIE